jgi:hypothetical protein
LVKEISISIAEQEVQPNQELHGTVVINYAGRYDSVVINSQIEKSSDVFAYSLLNGKKINHPYARLSIFKTELGGKTVIEFVASTKHVPADGSSNVKFRASLIQEHKEIYSDIVFIKIKG